MLTSKKLHELSDLVKFCPLVKRAGLNPTSVRVMMHGRRKENGRRDFTAEESIAVTRELEDLIARIRQIIQ